MTPSSASNLQVYMFAGSSIHNCLQSAPPKTSGYVKALSHGENTYLSPQQLTALSRRELHPGISASKSDSFTLGMTMLEICSLYTSRSCYDFQNFKVNWVVVEQLFQTCRTRYSVFLMNLIQEMLNEDENQRISFNEIQQILAPY